ncbi:MAG: phasin family protein [Rickettsiales endosymbiont of Dermacentor nuttalli]
MKRSSQVKKKASFTTHKIHKHLNNAGVKLKKHAKHVEHEMTHISPHGHKIDDSVITNNLTSVFAYGDAYMKMSETIGSQMFNLMNVLVAENLELSKDFFKCVSLTDMLKFQEKVFKANYQAVTNNMNSIISSMMD